MSKRIVAIIPARLESTRLPRKLLQKIGAKTLIQHTYDNAAQVFDHIYIATDSKEIRDYATAFGAEVIMTSKDCKNGTERIIEAAQNIQADVIVNIQGDEPLLEKDVIEKVIEALDGEAVVSTAIVKLKAEDANNPAAVKCVIDQKGYALYFSRSLIPGNKTGKYDQAITYYKHLGIYAYKKSFLPEYSQLKNTPLQMAEDLEQLKILEHGFKIKTAIVTSNGIGVDTQEDFNKVENIICKRNTSSSRAESAPR